MAPRTIPIATPYIAPTGGPRFDPGQMNRAATPPMGTPESPKRNAPRNVYFAIVLKVCTAHTHPP